MNYKSKVLLFLLCFTTLGFAQALKPKTYTQWVTKSADYMELNLLDSAEYALKQAINSDLDNDNNTWLMTSLGTIQQHLGKLDEAYMSLTAALNKHPRSVFILHQRAALLKEMEKWEEAKSDYNTILTVDSLDVDALYNRGVLKLEAKDRVGAEKDFAVAERHGEFSPYGLLGKALIYRLDENWEEAERIYTSVLNSHPDMTSLYLKRAECYLNLDQLSKLSADLQAAASIEFDNPMYYFLRGQLRLKQFDKLAALSDFKKAKELGMVDEMLHPWIKKTD
ncbi:MAG: tetratricopeptide repeat protein [Dysgonamonadaceae bacterium]|jgi:tetratricopeptide (TPR) repeat protein|nr:tetratricopeptide repeat protein [Dysgonamonadaceae bacterium]MDD3356155.1 tetratricopeptide repeat protein [Dysgonamonadaceae bacterium]MDD3727541.1 tetratricopeptide repeat protein [Dysgonamonadaceae bacterium]MDD4247027.1 tetratricopeptide repeat protein [Dysgonamonadaceae bacterium]MDD4605571.1 tetratricopeptide repeat protein [Dysgonamonadaceae bacterium]